MVRIIIVGAGRGESLQYPDDSNTKAVKEDLLGGYGRGVLKLDGVGVLSESLLAGEYQYHVTDQGDPATQQQTRSSAVKAVAFQPQHGAYF
jgi:hypothetical protein